MKLRAIMSVSDKTGIVAFGKGLAELGVEVMATGGTFKVLKEAGVIVTEVSSFTGFPEMLDGRVKTLHPKLHAGILGRRQDDKHVKQMQEMDYEWIDLVVVNLYPFSEVISREAFTDAEAIENIDIGGPTMIRAAAKNHQHVLVVCDPSDYTIILERLQAGSVKASDALRRKLAGKAYRHTADYDTVIANYVQSSKSSDAESPFPEQFTLSYKKEQSLRYGENPHQAAAFYRTDGQKSGLAALKQLHGKELSFNNILDLNAAIGVVYDFNDPAAVVIKHNNPTGIAVADNLKEAFSAAYATDPIAAFGGIIGLNQTVDATVAHSIFDSGFMECVIAPDFSQEALDILSKKKNLRLIGLAREDWSALAFDFKAVHGGLLIQEQDQLLVDRSAWTVASKKNIEPQYEASLNFGWSIIRHIRSNGIVLVKDRRTIGIGCGQTSRVASVKIAIDQAEDQAKGSVMVSDAFFPKVDNIELAAKAGVAVIVQTGGSIADADVIEAADAHGVVMVMTGRRHFKH